MLHFRVTLPPVTDRQDLYVFVALMAYLIAAHAVEMPADGTLPTSGTNTNPQRHCQEEAAAEKETVRRTTVPELMARNRSFRGALK